MCGVRSNFRSILIDDNQKKYPILLIMNITNIFIQQHGPVHFMIDG